MTLLTDGSDRRLVREMARLLNRGDDLTPCEMRRLAELHELYFNSAEATVWRQRALDAEQAGTTPAPAKESVMAPLAVPA
jgi:hypothetical protein